MQRPKGTKDNYGVKQNIRTYVRDVLYHISTLFNFSEIETPIFEAKEVFIKSVGETSDIVAKEMYEFKDKGDRNMVLRPEGTAGVIRAIVENKLYAEPLPLKYFYYGPMFRYENPQKGRQRQFTQYGIEIMGEKSPYLDAEAILMAATILNSLQIKYELKINSLGTKETRTAWSNALKKHLQKHKEELSEDSQRRLENNPMRILDDKVDGKKAFVKKAPKITEFYTDEVKDYFDKVTSFLTVMGINFTIDTNLVRGLDYYTDTTFEFVSLADSAGSQSTIIGGGRYENLVAQFGGPELAGIGFGLGVERLINDIESTIAEDDVKIKPEVYVLNIDEQSTDSALGIVYMLRVADIIAEWNYAPVKLQKAFEKADKSGASIKIIAGPKDLEQGQVMVKWNDQQEAVRVDALIEFVKTKLEENDEEN